MRGRLGLAQPDRRDPVPRDGLQAEQPALDERLYRTLLLASKRGHVQGRGLCVGTLHSTNRIGGDLPQRRVRLRQPVVHRAPHHPDRHARAVPCRRLGHRGANADAARARRGRAADAAHGHRGGLFHRAGASRRNLQFLGPIARHDQWRRHAALDHRGHHGARLPTGRDALRARGLGHEHGDDENVCILGAVYGQARRRGPDRGSRRRAASSARGHRSAPIRSAASASAPSVDQIPRMDNLQTRQALHLYRGGVLGSGRRRECS